MVQLLPSVVARAGAIGATGDTPTASFSQYGSRSVATNYGTQTAGGATFASAGSDAWNAEYIGQPLAYFVAVTGSTQLDVSGVMLLFALVLLPSLPPSLDLLLGLGKLDMGKRVKLLPLFPLLIGLDIDQWKWDLDHLRVDQLKPLQPKKKILLQLLKHHYSEQGHMSEHYLLELLLL